ncbi:MAG TPA: hypothetical protein V6D08_19825 [Candidatus Obscuribacterales bacterium]
MVGETIDRKAASSNFYKLNARIFQFAGPPEKDKVYRYCTEEGVQAYSQKDFARAEQLFLAAVADAEKRKIQGPALAMMLANLGSAQREEAKLTQSRNTFRLAITVLHNTAPNLRGSVNFTRALNYIAPQYAGLLRKLRLESEASFIEENPMTLLAAREDRSPLTGTVKKTDVDAGKRAPIPARAEKTAREGERGEESDLDRRSPFEDEKGTQPRAHGGGGDGSPAKVEQPGEQAPQREIVTIRQRTYQAEYVAGYEAIKAALHLLSKGMDVTVILDRLGVQAANRHEMTDVPERGSDRLVQVPALVRQFVEKGGTLLISEHWASHYGYVVGRELPQQAKLLTDEQMAEELAKRRGTIIDY